MDISKLVGKTINKVYSWDDEVLFVCGDEAYNMCHMQDCCETVSIYDIVGDLEGLAGQKVIDAQEHNDDLCDAYNYQPCESYTWTTFVITTESSKVEIRWLGESNGYYSESVYFGITHKPII